MARFFKFSLTLLVALLTLLMGLFVAYRVGLYVAEPDHEGVYALADARLFDGTDDALIEDATVIVEDNRIAAAGPTDELDVPDGAEIYELGGRTIIPGLFDAHVHLGGPELDEGEQPSDVGMFSIIWRGIQQAPDARQGFIEHGVTSIKSVGDPDDWIIGVHNSIDGGNIEGPRPFTSGPLITAVDGHPVRTLFAGNDYVIDTTTRQIADSDQGRERVAELHGLGVDFIKVVIDRGGDESWPTLDAQQLEAIVDEAHSRDLKVFAHWRYNDELDLALQAGVDGIEHPGYEKLTDDLVDRLVDKDITYTPTLATFAHDERAPRAARHNVRAIAEAGGQVVAGSDVPNVGLRFGPAVHRELELLVDSGLSEAHALHAATSDAADHIGQGHRLGKIEPGYHADITVVDGNPLDDISAVRNVDMVVKDGKILVGP